MSNEVTLDSIYPQRPEVAFRVTRAGVVLGTVFENWQGWISAQWREHSFPAVTAIHKDREAAISAFTTGSAT